jgi:hypothetical protein
MRCLEKNKSILYYSYYISKQIVQDQNGKKTGEYMILYSNPKYFKANVSIPKGYADITQFGINEQYDKVIVTENMELILDETTVLWIDKKPYIGNKFQSNDYRIVKIAKSLNSVTIFAKKVSTTENPEKFINLDLSPNDSNAGASACEVSEK